ncbi:MAG: DUF6221 family protein [Jatrophihabitans sp.]
MTLPVAVASDLVRFLLDRIDEDEDELRHLTRDEVRGPDRAAARPLGLRSVDRLRAELIAKRHVIGDLQQLLVLRDQPSEKTVRDAAAQALRALAAPYAAHRQYRTDWHAPKRR